MFPIVRYGADLEENESIDKESILQSLKKRAEKKSKLLKRKNAEKLKKEESKIVKKEVQNKEIQAKTEQNEKLDSDSSIKESQAKEQHTVDENSPAKADAENQIQGEHSDSGENVLEKYDPLEMFKLGLKAPRQSLSLELIKSRGEKLPEWLENPYYIETDVNNTENFDMTILHENIKQNLNRMGINWLFPVQTSILPAILYGIESEYLSRPNDICVCSPTGSGKTLSFAIPIIQYLLERQGSQSTSALVVVPTIELAKQVHGVFAELSQGCLIKCVLLGGSQLENETRMLKKKSKFGFNVYPDVIITTPGRLAHFLETPDVLNFENLRFLVIDEADRILDLIKQSWVRKLKDHLPQWNSTNHITLSELMQPKLNLQKLLFSATLSTDPERLKDLDLFRPRLFIAKTEAKSHLPATVKKAKYSIPSTLKEFTVCCESNLKPLMVLSILIKFEVKKALCFTGSAESARRLHLLLDEYAKKEILNAPCMEFSSLLTKKERKRNMSQFTTKEKSILICSDAVARGIDAVDIEVVILYDIPQFIEAYVHRAGRASRAGNEGSVYSIVSDNDMRHYKKLFKNSGLHLPSDFQIDEKLISELSEHYENALFSVQNKLEQSRKSR